MVMDCCLLVRVAHRVEMVCLSCSFYTWGSILCRMRNLAPSLQNNLESSIHCTHLTGDFAVFGALFKSRVDNLEKVAHLEHDTSTELVTDAYVCDLYTGDHIITLLY